MNLNEQNSEQGLRLLLAQRRTYTKAKLWSYAVLALGFVLFVAQFFKGYVSNLGEPLSYLGLLSGLIIWLFDKTATTKAVEKAAKIQEEFDTRVFNLPWNESKVGSKIPKESILEAAGNGKAPDNLRNWYEPDTLSSIQPNIAILLCQRYNASWEFRLKKRFAVLMNCLFWLFIIGILAAGIWLNYSLKEWVLTMLAPAIGLLYKIYDLHDAFKETGKDQEAVFEECEKEIESFKKTKIPPSSERLRLIQDKIYKYRNQKSLVPDWLYNLSRIGDQTRITKATAEIIDELNQTA